MTVTRKPGGPRQDLITPGNHRVIVGTFGKDGDNGWDLWVPALCAVTKITRKRNGGTLIRIVPDSAFRD